MKERGGVLKTKRHVHGRETRREHGKLRDERENN